LGVPALISRFYRAENESRRAIRLYLFALSMNGKKDTASIPNAVQILTSMSKSARQVFLSKNLLLFGTTAIRGGVEQCTSLYIAQRRVFALQKLASAWNHGHPCPF